MLYSCLILAVVTIGGLYLGSSGHAEGNMHSPVGGRRQRQAGGKVKAECQVCFKPRREVKVQSTIGLVTSQGESCINNDDSNSLTPCNGVYYTVEPALIRGVSHFRFNMTRCI